MRGNDHLLDPASLKFGENLRANGVLKYVNKIIRGMEVNTSLLLYKSLVRSMCDYASFVYTPNSDNEGRVMLERAQYAGLRTVMGYRMSTPTNVIIAETKVMYIRDRARFLAKNFMLKILCSNRDNFCIELDDLARREDLASIRRPWCRSSILVEAWKKIKRDKIKILPPGSEPIWVFNIPYWI